MLTHPLNSSFADSCLLIICSTLCFPIMLNHQPSSLSSHSCPLITCWALSALSSFVQLFICSLTRLLNLHLLSSLLVRSCSFAMCSTIYLFMLDSLSKMRMSEHAHESALPRYECVMCVKPVQSLLSTIYPIRECTCFDPANWLHCCIAKHKVKLTSEHYLGKARLFFKFQNLNEISLNFGSPCQIWSVILSKLTTFGQGVEPELFMYDSKIKKENVGLFRLLSS